MANANNVYLVERSNGEEHPEDYHCWVDSVWDTYEGAVWHIENELKMTKHTPKFNDADWCAFWEGNANEYGSIPEAWITKHPVYTCL